MSYWQKLMAHPGLGIAAGTTALFAVAGGPTLRGAAAGVLASLCFWVPVLWSAVSQPVEEDENE